MFGNNYYLEEGLNLCPIGDVMPEDPQQNQNHYAAMQAVMVRQQAQVRLPVNNYDFTQDALRQNQDWQRQLQQQDRFRQRDLQAERNFAREQAQLNQERQNLAAERQRLMEMQQQRPAGLTNAEIDALSATIAARIAGRAPTAEPRLTPQQVEAEREALRQQVYGEVQDEIQQQADVITQTEPVGETSAPEAWTAEPTIKPIVLVGE